MSDETNVWIVGDKNLKTTNAGQSWESFWYPSSYKITSVQFINQSNEIGWFTGRGGTILKYYNDEPTSIDSEEFISTLSEFSLSNNFPNPFNPVTKIKFKIPGQARNDNALVTLKVYDILGREIATLVNEEKRVGSYEVEFNASELSSGIYFYRIQAGRFIETKKMVLLR